MNQVKIHGRKRTFVVIFTFYASIVSFFVAGCYDYTRPVILSRLPGLLEKLSSLFCISSTVASTLTILETLFLAPTILFLLPLTKYFWTRYKKSKPTSSLIPPQKPNATAATIITRSFVLKLLDGIAWSLWVSALVALLCGVLFLPPHRFGCISFAALLALFAHCIGLIGILWDWHRDEEDEDDIRRELMERTVDDGVDLSQSADSWVRGCGRPNMSGERRDCDAGKSDDGVRTKLSGCEGFVLKRKTSLHPPMTNKSPNNLSTPSRNMTVDFIIFFLMNTGLVQFPYYLQVGIHYGDINGSIPKEIPGTASFVVTILVPLFTHGVGGRMFHRDAWSFHHAFQGGKSHITAQATGWSLLSFAALMHLSFLILGMENKHVYLLHSGSILAWVAEVALLYSLLIFRPTSSAKSDKSFSKVNPCNTISDGLFWFLFSFFQDMIVTNLHWFFTFWLLFTMMGFNTFSLEPTKQFLNSSFLEVAQNTILLLSTWSLVYIFVPYTSRKKKWSHWNPFAFCQVLFERVVFHRKGIFGDSKLRCEERIEDYQKEGACFAILPHGTLPTSVLAVLYQFGDKYFKDVCLFFGSQLSIVPGYRFLLGMRGGCMPVEKKNLVKVMRSRQNVSLLPGGVHEMLKCVPHEKTINVSIKHKGFVKLAIQEGYDLIPTFFFHANDQFNNPLLSFQSWTYKLTKIPVGLPIYVNKYFLPMSNRNPIRVALGRRIAVKQDANPSQEEVERVHRLFYEEVARIWEKYKVEFGYGDRELAYVS